MIKIVIINIFDSQIGLKNQYYLNKNLSKLFCTHWQMRFILLSSLDNTDEEQVDELTLPNFKIYFKATVIKRA